MNDKSDSRDRDLARMIFLRSRSQVYYTADYIHEVPKADYTILERWLRNNIYKLQSKIIL